MATALAVDVEKRFASGALVAARFEVQLDAGAVLVLFGPSGSGKTTVLRCLAGLERPDRGRIRFGARAWLEDERSAPPQARRIGYVFQQGALFPHLTVRANIAFGLTRQPEADRRRRVDEMLALFEIDDLAARYPRELSGGQIQRVSPQLLLLDEPFASVDNPTRARLRSDLRAVLRQSALPAVLVTHDRTEALALGDDIAVLVDGRIRQVGPVADVMSRPADLDVARSVGVETVIPATVESYDRGLVAVRAPGAVLHAVARDAFSPGSPVFACIRAEDVAIERLPAGSGSIRNHLSGRIERIEQDGPLERVTLDCGVQLVALITRTSREELGLAPGIAVTAAIKATAVHVVARG